LNSGQGLCPSSFVAGRAVSSFLFDFIISLELTQGECRNYTKWNPQPGPLGTIRKRRKRSLTRPPSRTVSFCHWSIPAQLRYPILPRYQDRTPSRDSHYATDSSPRIQVLTRIRFYAVPMAIENVDGKKAMLVPDCTLSNPLM
jgi:hypothetical protein